MVEIVLGDVRIDLRRLQAPVPEEQLDLADVDPAFEQVSREAVALIPRAG